MTAMVMVSDGANDWPQMFGPFDDEEQARDWAEVTFPRRTFTVMVPSGTGIGWN